MKLNQGDDAARSPLHFCFLFGNFRSFYVTEMTL